VYFIICCIPSNNLCKVRVNNHQLIDPFSFNRINCRYIFLQYFNYSNKSPRIVYVLHFCFPFKAMPHIWKCIHPTQTKCNLECFMSVISMRISIFIFYQKFYLEMVSCKIINKQRMNMGPMYLNQFPRNLNNLYSIAYLYFLFQIDIHQICFSRFRIRLNCRQGIFLSMW